MARTEIITEKKMPQRRPAEKLVGEEVRAMLFPAAAFDDAQRQEQKKEGERDIEHDVARVHQPAREVVHLVQESDLGEHVREPAGADLMAVRQETQQEQR